jgi:hypothetical protein
MAYVIVEDVAASWEQYAHFASALSGPAPAGLIVHAAGPTDEGFRVVALWESEEAWRRFAECEGSVNAAPRGVVRALHSEHVVYGEGSVELAKARLKRRPRSSLA